MNIVEKEPVVVIYKLTDEEINYFLSKRDKKGSNVKKRPERKKKQEASRNLKDVSRVDFTLFENYRRERLKFLNKKARKCKNNSQSGQAAKAASLSIEKQKDRPIAPKLNVSQLVVHSQGTFPQHFTYAGYSTQVLPLQVFQNQQQAVHKDTTLSVKKQSNNRKRPSPFDSDSDCDENYGIILSSSKDSTFFMHNYAFNPSKQGAQPFPKQFPNSAVNQKISSAPPPGVLINEHDILSAIGNENDPLSKVITNLNSNNFELNSSDLKTLITKESCTTSNFCTGSTLRQNLPETSPLTSRGPCVPGLAANSLKSGMLDTLTSGTVKNNKYDCALEEFDVVSKIMLEMNAEFGSRTKLSSPEHELNNQQKSVQQSPVLPNIALPKGMTLTLVEPVPPKDEIPLNKQGNKKESKTAADCTAKVTTCQSKVAAKVDSPILEKTVEDVVKNIVDEVSRKMFIASISRTGAKLNHLQVNKPIKRVCARCKCVLVHDAANRYSCKNCKSLLRVSPRKFDGGLKVGVKNCDKIKPVNVKHKVEKLGRTPSKLWKSLTKYDQNRLSYLKHSLSQNKKKNVKVSVLNNNLKKSVLHPLKEKSVEKGSKYVIKKPLPNSFTHKLKRNSSSVDLKNSTKKRQKIEDSDEQSEASDSVEKLGDFKDTEKISSEDDQSHESDQDSVSNDVKDKKTSNQNGDTCTKKGSVEVKNINRGLFLMTYGEPHLDIDMSAGNELAVDSENSLASRRKSVVQEKEKSSEPPEKEKASLSVEKEETTVSPPESGSSSHTLLQNRTINEIECTYVIPQVPSIIVAKYSSDKSQNGDYLLASVSHIQQNPPKASLNVVKTSTVTTHANGQSQSELSGQSSSQSPSQTSDTSVADTPPTSNGRLSDQEACSSKTSDSSVSVKEVSISKKAQEDSSGKEKVSSPRTEPSVEGQSCDMPNVTAIMQSISNKTAAPESDKIPTPATAESKQDSDSSLLANLKEALDMKRRNISHELDAVAILSILDLDGSRSRSETLLRSLLDKEFKELKEIRGMKISELDGEVKNIVAMKMNRILDTIKSLQLATVLFTKCETLEKVVETVLNKPEALKENPPLNNLHVPVNEKVSAKLEGRQDCRFASCSASVTNTQNSAVTMSVSISANNESQKGVSNITLNPSPNVNPRIQCKTEAAAAASSCCMQSGTPRTGSATNPANYLERIEKQVSSIAPQNSTQLPSVLQTYRQFPPNVLQNANPSVRSMMVQQTQSPVQQLQSSQSPTQRMPSPMQPAQSPVQRMQSPMQPVHSPMQPVQSPLQQVRTSPLHPAPSPMHPPQSPMQPNHSLSLPNSDDMHRTPSNGSSGRPGSGRPLSTENAAMPLSPAAIKKEALSAPSPCSGTGPMSSETGATIADHYTPQLNMSLQPSPLNPFPDDVVYSNGMLIHRQAPPAYSPTVRSIGPPNRTAPFTAQLPFPNMGNNRFSGYNPMQTVPNPAVGMSNQVALYNQQMTNSGVRVQQVVLPSSNSNLQQLSKPYAPSQVSGVQGNGGSNNYTLQTQTVANVVPATNAMTASSQVVPVQNSLRLAQGSQGTNASSFQTVPQATAQVMQQPNWNKESSSNGSVMFCALCKNLATLRCKQCTKVAFCNTTCAKIYWHHRHKNECKPQT